MKWDKELAHVAQVWTLLLALQLPQLGLATDYCQLQSCPGGSHTECKFPPGSGPSDKCSKDANGLGDADRDHIVSEHNTLRNKLASGQLDGFSGATDMQTMKWDTELESVAQTWADQCDYGHDECRHVDRFPVGQNIAMTGSSAGFQTDIDKKIMMWWDEYKEYPYHDGTFKFMSGTGHFTQMAWAKTNLIGCGRSSYVKSGFTNEYLVCNYGPAGNVMGQRVYTASANQQHYSLNLSLLMMIYAVTRIN